MVELFTISCSTFMDIICNTKVMAGAYFRLSASELQRRSKLKRWKFNCHYRLLPCLNMNEVNQTDIKLSFIKKIHYWQQQREFLWRKIFFYQNCSSVFSPKCTKNMQNCLWITTRSLKSSFPRSHQRIYSFCRLETDQNIKVADSIQTRLMIGELTMFKTNTPMSQNEFKNLLIESLNWESFEQQSLWMLIFAHKSVKPESWGVIIPYLNEEIHFGN